jgi:hypothetical protein
MGDATRHLRDARDIYVLKEYQNIWNSYRLFLKPCRNMFAYLDKFYIPQNSLMPLQKKGFLFLSLI